MRVLTCSRFYPKGHPQAGQPTWFVEKIWKSLWDGHEGGTNPLYPYWQTYDQAFPLVGDMSENIHQHAPKHHTIRIGNRWSVGDMVSLRVWSDKPYRSKQVEFAQVAVKKVWTFELKIIDGAIGIKVNGQCVSGLRGPLIARNDGLEWLDFVHWFNIHPKKKQQVFAGQIICWNDKINY